MKNRACGKILLGFLLLVSQLSWGQSEQDLADEYFKNGEFEKAAAEYGKQVRKNEENGGPAWQTVYRYVVSLKKSKKADEADRQLKRWAKAEGNLKTYALLLIGQNAQEAGDTLTAKKQFSQVYEASKSDPMKIARVGELFEEISSSDWAIQAYQRGQQLTEDPTFHAEDLATLYRGKGDTRRWIETLLPLSQKPDQRERVQGAYQALINTKEEALLETVLYERVQKEPESIATNEMLTWYYLQKQKFSRALLQEKAMDKRLKLSGAKVFELAQLAMTNREYKTAIDSYEYIIQTYPQGTFYPYARRMIINAREEQVKNVYPIEKAEIRKLIYDYQRVLSDVGITPKTLDALRNSANLYANYLDEKDSALVMLDKAITMGKSDPLFVDKCKLDKGDVYLLKNEPWESTLLYSQVEKSQKDDLLGYEAKLKNAKLHYYRGDFTLAKGVLDVLKMATTREIANDAEQLSMLILDNTGLDSTEAAMKEYSAIDLLLFQNKLDEATSQINGMLKKYEKHTLADELIWLQSKIYMKEGKIDEAIANLKTIVDKYPLDILGDDALYEMAKLTDERKKNTVEALKLYQQFLTTYPGSLFAADARKRLRQLRGDQIN
ncbi:tetratricopeptide repeat protein [Fibrella forsythiae]|uniref:Tetratricopeptide repeat protein n=1 Tax=Fibrella forsythiae TaxID=2817061 RepID=A0ABS3JJM2_9BACT|nr:tetratricopeptide repeat protein [Fibrella forsythiae]MBO0950198.1 tetratricopeptide repeat protein [Fibrella forsythiae]